MIELIHAFGAVVSPDLNRLAWPLSRDYNSVRRRYDVNPDYVGKFGSQVSCHHCCVLSVSASVPLHTPVPRPYAMQCLCTDYALRLVLYHSILCNSPLNFVQSCNAKLAFRRPVRLLLRRSHRSGLTAGAGYVRPLAATK